MYKRNHIARRASRHFCSVSALHHARYPPTTAAIEMAPLEFIVATCVFFLDIPLSFYQPTKPDDRLYFWLGRFCFTIVAEGIPLLCLWFGYQPMVLASLVILMALVGNILVEEQHFDRRILRHNNKQQWTMRIGCFVSLALIIGSFISLYMKNHLVLRRLLLATAYTSQRFSVVVACISMIQSTKKAGGSNIQDKTRKKTRLYMSLIALMVSGGIGFSPLPFFYQAVGLYACSVIVDCIYAFLSHRGNKKSRVDLASAMPRGESRESQIWLVKPQHSPERSLGSKKPVNLAGPVWKIEVTQYMNWVPETTA
ncbi:hypothetical protein EDB80DRAFT_783572 [Ilyonectria destructans]|nr:hypothetical protein EDB80DRAFT_783572 [Ilyonectria destructans]